MLKDTEIATRKSCPMHLQLPPEMYLKIRSLARQNDHTANHQVNLILRDFFGEKQKEAQEAK